MLYSLFGLYISGIVQSPNRKDLGAMLVDVSGFLFALSKRKRMEKGGGGVKVSSVWVLYSEMSQDAFRKGPRGSDLMETRTQWMRQFAAIDGGERRSQGMNEDGRGIG